MTPDPKNLLATATEVTSPLPVIALFILLSQALAGYGAIATSGTTGTIFTCFAVSFPFVVLAVFVWLLVTHTQKSSTRPTNTRLTRRLPHSLTYGIEWILARNDHEALTDIGSNWAEARGYSYDERLLREVGINPGSTLTAIRRDHRKFPGRGRNNKKPSVPT